MSKLKKINIDEDGDGIEYNTPYAFTNTDDKDDDMMFEKEFKKVQESIKRINEISYNNFKQDESQTIKQKLNNNIAEINKGMAHAERLINHALRLKTEAGANQTIFLKETFRRFAKISERMNRLQSKIREFSK